MSQALPTLGRMLRSLYHATALLLGIVWSTFSAPTHAQWQWLDDSGRKVFSDRPPPPSVPAQKVLQTPSAKKITTKQTPSQSISSDAAPKDKASDTPSSNDMKGNASSEAAASAPPSLPEKPAQDVQQARLRQEDCARARNAQALMRSGQLISHVNAQGQRGFVDDSTKQQEISRLQQVIASNCA